MKSFLAKMYRFFLLIGPYIIAIILGAIFFYLSFVCSNLRDLLINISATSFSIVTVLVIFDSIKALSHRKLNVKIHEYINFRYSRILLPLLVRICRLISSNEKATKLSDINDMGNQSLDSLKTILPKKAFLGFDIFIDWDKYLIEIEILLNEQLVYNFLSDNNKIALLEIYKAIKTFGDFINANHHDLFIFEKVEENYELYKNSKGPFTLFYNKENISWAYFNQEYHEKFKCTYKLKPECIDPFSDMLIKIIKIFDKSIEQLGNHLILDPNLIINSKHKPY